MAWYIHRFAQFLDDNGSGYQLEILNETPHTPQNSDEFTLGPDGFTISYSGNGKDIDDPIKSSECSFTFYSENSTDDAFFLDIMNAEVGKYLVKISRNPSNAIFAKPHAPESYI